jgi:putative phage-type endonuclease
MSIQQNTPEWLEMRKKYLGGSDAPIIMKESPWTTPFQLWQEKLDLIPPKEETFPMLQGKRKENPALVELEKITGYLFFPQVVFHPQIKWMMASLDAVDPENKIIAEIKCPGKEDHAKAQSGNVPEKYFPQLQHQMEVCQLETAYYFSFHVTGNVLLKITRNDEYIKNMLKAEEQFYECLQTLEPPELIERDYEQRSDPQWLSVASQWRSLNDALKTMEKQEKALKDQLIKIAHQKNCMGAGIKLSRYFRKGNIEYTAIPELQNVELEQYRKKPSECYRISSM